jgi:hypothetical protein
MTPRQLALLAPLALVAACTKPVSVGSFELEVPSGWQSQTDEGTLIIGERDLAWTWAFATETASQLQDQQGGLTEASKSVAREFAAEEEADDTSLTFGEPTELALGEGLVGVSLTGDMVVENLPMQLRVVIVVAGSHALVGVGFRTPNANAGDDAKTEQLLASIRAR